MEPMCYIPFSNNYNLVNSSTMDVKIHIRYARYFVYPEMRFLCHKANDIYSLCIALDECNTLIVGASQLITIIYMYMYIAMHGVLQHY